MIDATRRGKENTEKLEQHQAWVEQLLENAEGGAGMLDNTIKPKLRREVINESLR